MILMLLMKLFRVKAEETIGPDRTGIYVRREKTLQSGLLGIPIYINAKKVGIVKNEKTKFLDVPLGTFTVQAGKRKQASELFEVKVEEKDQLNFVFDMIEEGLRIKC